MTWKRPHSTLMHNPRVTGIHSSPKERQLQKCCVSFRNDCRYIQHNIWAVNQKGMIELIDSDCFLHCINSTNSFSWNSNGLWWNTPSEFPSISFVIYISHSWIDLQEKKRERETFPYCCVERMWPILLDISSNMKLMKGFSTINISKALEV